MSRHLRKREGATPPPHGQRRTCRQGPRAGWQNLAGPADWGQRMHVGRGGSGVRKSGFSHLGCVKTWPEDNVWGFTQFQL
eukprot:5396208-Prymnesium_polylepis.1